MTKVITVQEFSKNLATQQKSFESILPSHIPAKKFMRTVVGAVQNNPDLLACNQESVMQSCQRAAQDGLILDNSEAAMVIFNTKDGNKWVKKAQYMPMVKGIMKSLRNSGKISTLSTQIVHKNDEFSYDPGAGVLKHNPDWFGDRGEAIGVYAMAILTDGSQQVEILNQTQLEKIRKVSKSGSDKQGNPIGIWKQWPEEMWRKSALRKLAKYLPSSADIDQMFTHDNDNYDHSQAETAAPQEKVVAPVAEASDINSMMGESVDTETGEVLEGEFDEMNPPPLEEDIPI